ncbi:protein disulfide-isomerase TMX3-like isoform X2 [Lineus longissimus]|uniref:protein disulfide-isomerase TMX3-like isoform X2 n=1 Tax=Lineus longissimus TaxID=88925 RepID=UPI002B4E70E4
MAAIMKMKIGIFIFLSGWFFRSSTAQVEELTEKFVTDRGENSWLVMFYAPWCGHCKKMNPAFHRVGLELKDSDIRVGKVDCTLYQSLAHMFEVRGFPTIKFIRGNKAYTHRGERSKEDILEFAYRAHGPVVRNITSLGRFHEIRSQHSSGVFFLYVGEPDVYGTLFNKYSAIAEKYRVQSYFYSATKRVLPGDVKVESFPSVHVFKDKKMFTFEGEVEEESAEEMIKIEETVQPKADGDSMSTSDSSETCSVEGDSCTKSAPSAEDEKKSDADGAATKSELEKWINVERFLAFPRVQGANLNEYAAAKKLLVMFMVNTEDKDNKEKQERVKAMGELLAMEKIEQYHDSFQFIWMGDTESGNSITMSELTTPNLLVLNPETQLYYLPREPVEDMPLDVLEKFLVDVKEEKIEAHGGTGFLQRVKRLLYDIFTTLLSIWQSSRILFFVMFGIPTAIISIVCYGLCCMETSDEEYTEEEEEEEPAIERNAVELEDAEMLKIGAKETPTIPKSPDDKKND